jgi:hypothetical protein
MLMPDPVSRSLRARLRAVAIGGISVLVVLAAVLYVVAPSRPVLDLTVSELTDAPSYDLDITADYSLAAATVAAKAKYRETIYGQVLSPSGIPISRARVVIRGAAPKVRGMRATIRIHGTKAFRSVVRLRPGRYEIHLLLRADGRNQKVSVTKRIRNGRSYQILAVVRESGIVTMLPISSY